VKNVLDIDYRVALQAPHRRIRGWKEAVGKALTWILHVEYCAARLIVSLMGVLHSQSRLRLLASVMPHHCYEV
jgi:hypothetical protein